MAGHVTTRLDEIIDAAHAGDLGKVVEMLEALGDWAIEVEDELYAWKRGAFEATQQLVKATNRASAGVRTLRSLRLA